MQATSTSVYPNCLFIFKPKKKKKLTVSKVFTRFQERNVEFGRFHTNNKKRKFKF